MKKERFIYSLMSGLIIIFLLIIMACITDYIETHYTREECEVVNIENNTIWVVDKTDNLWMFDVEDNLFEVGDIVDLQMHTNHTDSNIFDDIILKVKN